MTLPWHRLYQVSDLLNFVAEIRAMSGSESNNRSEFYLKKKNKTANLEVWWALCFPSISKPFLIFAKNNKIKIMY